LPPAIGAAPGAQLRQRGGFDRGTGRYDAQVIVLDANVLLYAYDVNSENHTKARAWVEQVFSDGTPIGLPWQTVAAFLRVVTNPRLPGKRFTPEEAAQIVDQWLDQPNVRLLAAGDQHWTILRQMMIGGQARGPLVSDAQLAALAIEYGGILQTTDRDFARFPGLRWSNPLE
jgi:toxin-antitoxin system PIN domain toxin